MAYTTPSTWVGTTVVTAAQLNAQIRDNMDHVNTNMSYGAGVLLTAATVSGTVSSLTLSTAVPQTYRNLFIRGEGVSGYGAIGDLYLRINNDSANNYKWANVGRDTSAAAIDESSAAAAGIKVIKNFGTTTTGQQNSSFDCRIFQYTSTTVARNLLGASIGNTQYCVSVFGSYIAIGTTIGTMSVYCSAGSLSAGEFYVYGFNG